MAAYPVLILDQTVMKAAEQPANWSAAMTYKFVGVLRSLTEPKPSRSPRSGWAWGWVRDRGGAQGAFRPNHATSAFAKRDRAGFATDFRSGRDRLAVALRVLVRRLREPGTSAWFAAAASSTSLYNTFAAQERGRRGCLRT
jgi:hypothetical protein